MLEPRRTRVREHRPELDGLRAIAITAVVLFHVGLEGPFDGGFIGVDLFFVLSAFLITSILADEWRQEGSVNLRRFYWRRFLRLMPALLFMLVGYLAVAPFVWPGYSHARDALAVGLYISDYTYAFWQVPRYLNHTWSLAVEEHFYLLWPLLLPFLLRSKRPLLWLAMAFVALTFWRTSHADDFNQYYFRSDMRATGLVAGAALYFSGFRPGRMAGIISFALFAAIIMFARFPYAFAVIPLAEIASVGLVASAAGLPFLRASPLVWLGQRSYAVYLWHLPIANACRDYHLSHAWTAALTFALSAILAELSWRTVEAWGKGARSGLFTRWRIARSSPLSSPQD